MPRIVSAPLPAGQSRPVKIPTGKKSITIGNPNAGTGTVEFFISDIPIYIHYNPIVVNPGGTFDIPDTVNNPEEPNDDNYFCFYNWDDDGKSVIVNIDEIVAP